jgi:hypothetical protein
MQFKLTAVQFNLAMARKNRSGRPLRAASGELPLMSIPPTIRFVGKPKVTVFVRSAYASAVLDPDAANRPHHRNANDATQQKSKFTH